MHPYLAALAETYKQNAIKTDAPVMEAYMKNHFKFYGLKSPLRKTLTKNHVKQFGILSYNDLSAVVRQAYEQPYRELHYFAMDLLEVHRKNLQKKDIDLVRWMILHQSWWDSVDFIATRGAGALVQKFPELATTMDAWSIDKNMWLRRVAILHQMKFKQQTDTQRLFAYCVQNAADKEFFIQKAMGWALREYVYIDPKAVINFLKAYQMPNLTVREAKKHLPSK